MRRESFTFRSRIPVPAEELFDWHSREGAFQRLTPPWESVRLVSQSGGIEDGAAVEIRVKVGPFWRRWVAKHRGYEPGRQFQDVQTIGPFALWEHTHTITPDGPTASFLEDHIEFALPGGPIVRLLGNGQVRQKLQRVFEYRHRTTAADLIAHRYTKGNGTMKILVTGSTGLIGSALMNFLSTGGHDVFRLVRSPSSDRRTIQWDPQLGNIDRDRLSGFDAVVHLAGENIAKRWTKKQKARIRRSRVDATELLCGALARSESPPKTIVCASAVGFYGDRGEEILDEQSPPGQGFLPDICRAWEDAALSVKKNGVRVVPLRFGIVLSPAGGALQKMLLPFKLGMGGVIGSGAQFWSWIGIDDAIGAIHHALTHETLSGPVNAVAPEPVTNRVFTETLGRVLHRPTLLPMPAFAARAVFGQMANGLFLASARVVPRRLEESGYQFRQRDLESALRHVLGRPAKQG